VSNSERRGRAAVVLRDETRVALIKRVRDGRTYFVFPGGGIRGNETPAEAATRQARRELGVDVLLGPRLLIEEFRGETAHYFSALIVGGEFGSSGDANAAGESEPVWMELADLPYYRVHPRALAAILTGG
jgi:8-oxo-dGTP diphosphatase